MPLYFFDIDDSETVTRDADGQDHTDLDAAVVSATRTLPRIASDILPDHGNRSFSITVSDQTRRPVANATLAFVVTVFD